MKSLKGRMSTCMATTALLTALMGTPLLAQDTPPPPPPDQTQGPPPQGGGPRGGMMNPERRVEMMQRQLNLTPDQTTQLRSIFADGQSKMEAMRSNTALAPQDRRTQMMALRQAEHDKVVALLTPDQKTKFEAMEARRQEQMRGRGPGGDGQGPPPTPPAPPQQ